MQFNLVALFAGLLATLAPAVAVDSGAAVASPTPFSGAEHNMLAPKGLPGDRAPIDLNMFPVAVQSCLSGNYTGRPTRRRYSLRGKTVRQICGGRRARTLGAKLGSSIKSFRKFEKHVYRHVRRCPGVDMEPLEHFFWQVNYRCHDIWYKRRGRTLDQLDRWPPQEAGADVAVEEEGFAADAAEDAAEDAEVDVSDAADNED